MITKHLPTDSRMVASQTCRRLRSLTPPPNPLYLPRATRVKFLSAIAKDMPERWACGYCARLHRVGVHSCSTRQRLNACFTRVEVFDDLDTGFGIEHHHLQLTLKYTRMGITDAGRRERLRRLLSPIWAPFKTHFYSKGVLHAHTIVYPLVAGGRYFIQEVSQYSKNHAAVSPKALGYGQCCHHQKFDYEGFRCIGIGPTHPKGALMNAIAAAFKIPGVAVHGYCPYCPVDFSVEATLEYATIRTWKDLGPEDTPCNPYWRVYASRDGEGVTLRHESGAVRDAYCRAVAILALQLG